MSEEKKAYLKSLHEQPAEEELVESVTAKKLKLSDNTTSSDHGSSSQPPWPPLCGNRILDMSSMQTLLHNAAICGKCKKGQLDIMEDPQKRFGMFTPFSLRCGYCLNTVPLDRPAQTQTDGKHRFLDINRRIVLAFRSFGKGTAAMENFCALLNIPPPLSKRAFASHVQALKTALLELTATKLQEAVSELKSFLTNINPELEGQSVVDVTVSTDGTWMKRGFTSLFGCVFVISVDTGKVLDFEVLSRYCKSCEIWSKRDPESEEYLQWKAQHDEQCAANFSKSSKAMEAKGAVVLWNRSVSQNGLRYTGFIGDGDSAAHTSVVESKPYGDGVKIEKKECVGHIQKRMGSALRNLVTVHRGKKLSDGKTIGGRGRLTLVLIDKFQKYYGKAIRSNKGDVEGASKAVKAILYHSASTNERPQHDNCPQGEDSWCGWQRDVAKGTTTYKHTHPLPQSIVDVLQPIFQRLSNPVLLEGSKDCFTQNPNESLHHLVWDKCPKSSFAGAATVEIAACLGMLEFNGGHHCYAELLTTMGIEPGYYAQTAFTKRDKERLYHASRKSCSKTKRRRTVLKSQKKASADKQQQSEGPLYEAGAFLPTDISAQPSKPRKSRATPHCKKCGKPMKGHRKGQPCVPLQSSDTENSTGESDDTDSESDSESIV